MSRRSGGGKNNSQGNQTLAEPHQKAPTPSQKKFSQSTTTSKKKDKDYNNNNGKRKAQSPPVAQPDKIKHKKLNKSTEELLEPCDSDASGVISDMEDDATTTNQATQHESTQSQSSLNQQGKQNSGTYNSQDTNNAGNSQPSTPLPTSLESTANTLASPPIMRHNNIRKISHTRPTFAQVNLSKISTSNIPENTRQIILTSEDPDRPITTINPAKLKSSLDKIVGGEPFYIQNISAINQS